MTPYRRSLAGASLTLLALVLLGFLVDVVLLGEVRHARAQRIAYADLRTDLAAATAPTGPLGADGRPLRLGTPVATLTAPGLGLVREVVFEGTTSAVLAKGPGHLRSSVLPGQAGTAVLLGRAWSHGGPFGGAEDLPEGSVLTVTTGQGAHTYAVTGVRRAGDVVPALPSGRARLTLVTATGAAFVPEQVVYVDAELTSTPVPAPVPLISTPALSAAELPLEGEPTTWPVVVLLLQGFALSAVALAWAVRRHGRAQAWVAGTPVVVLLFLLSSQQVSRLLPNLL